MAAAADNNLMRVVETLVLRGGLRNALLAISGSPLVRLLGRD